MEDYAADELEEDEDDYADDEADFDEDGGKVDQLQSTADAEPDAAFSVENVPSINMEPATSSNANAGGQSATAAEVRS